MNASYDSIHQASKDPGQARSSIKFSADTGKPTKNTIEKGGDLMKHYGDICKMNGALIERCECVIGGSPCQ